MRKINSPMQRIEYLGRTLHLKRDDLLSYPSNSIPSMLVNGNKIRKFKYLLELSRFPKLVISYGGIQSNSMAALAQIVNMTRNSTFYYITNEISQTLKDYPIGNYKYALQLGMKVVEVSREQYRLVYNGSCTSETILKNHFHLENSLDVFTVSQGGAMKEASVGLSDLADETVEYIQSQSCSYPSSSSHFWRICVESGTGATALFLAQHLKIKYPDLNAEVMAIPCVGTAKYLQEQMETLDNQAKQLKIFPKILHSDIKRTFAKPCKDHLDLWIDLKEKIGVEFDLIYAPRAFEQIFEKIKIGSDLWKECNLIYIHCGGVNGNESQLQRCKYLEKVGKLH